MARKHRKLTRAVAAVLAGNALVAWAPAHSQGVTPAVTSLLEEVVVTGSRIARRDYASNSPLVSVTAEASESPRTPVVRARPGPPPRAITTATLALLMLDWGRRPPPPPPPPPTTPKKNKTQKKKKNFF